MRRLILPVVLVAGIFVWLVLRGGRGEDHAYSGTIEARDARVGSLVGGRVLDVLVEEGDSVQAGQVLVRLDGDLLVAQVREQEARVAQAQAALDRVVSGPRREQIERARIEWDRAEKERKRQESLLAQALTSDEAYDAAAAAAQSAFQVYEELRAGSRSEDERQARAAWDEARSHLVYLQRQLAETEVRSPSAGVVQTIDLRPGDMVAANQGIVAILAPDELWVRVFVPETRLGRVRVGQSVDVTIDTFPERAFPARVASVSARAEYTPRNVQTVEQREDQVFAVKLDIEPAPELKAGMTATVRLE
ncbi:MAG TPA: HlyD family efflux transporter periplasmic adaptor subunit, partial [Candidatus Krumholzibacteria bacterium]|nr:HlyD family efflux transporter periplasmic adaptor subunit [Candidatus Krumholzibacteria bacterium]